MFEKFGEFMLEIPFVICSQSRFRRLSCGGVVLASLALDEFSEWSATVFFKLGRGFVGSRERSELKEIWQMQSRLMGGRSGRANSVQNLIFFKF